MVSLNLKQKLLLLWFGSILLSLLLLTVVYLVLNQKLHHSAVQQQMVEAFDSINDQLEERNLHLVQHVRSLTSRRDIIASLSMIHNYQNPADYQPIIFDVEKKKLGGELIELLRLVDVSIVAAYDGHMRLSSFAYFDEQGHAHIGYLSYKNGAPRYYLSDSNLENYHEVETLPLWLGSGVSLESDIHYHEHVHAHGDSVIMGFHLPVVRQLQNEFEETVGLITADRLGSEFAEEVSKRTGLEFMFSVNGSGWITAEHDVQDDEDMNVLSSVDLVDGDLHDWQMIDLGEYIYGVANYPLDDGESIKFAFRVSEFQTDPTVLQQAMISVLLMNLLLLLPLGVYFLRRTVLHPLSDLVAGIESLREGDYKQLSVPPSKDELAFLTNCFNSMSSSIRRRETELQKLSLAVEQSPVSMIITNLEGDIEYVNSSFTEVTGYSPSDVIGKNTHVLQGGETPVEVYQGLWETITSGREWQGIFHNRKKNGDLIWESTRIIPIKTPDEQIINYLALNEDITQRRQVEEQLYLQSEALQAAADGIVITNNIGDIEWVNPAYEKITGYSFEDVEGKNSRILKSGLQDSDFYKQLWKCILSGRTWYGELYNKRKDGVIYLEEESITPVKDVSGEITHFVAVKRDITALRKHEEIVRQSRKLEAIGEMAGGIAHDFNNLLGIMSGNLEILKRFSGDNADMNKWIDSGLRTAKRGAALTKRLLGFSRLHAAEVKTVSVSHMLEDMRPMIEKTAGPKIGVNYGLEQDLWLTDIDAGDFEDVIINLVINAKDAMQGKGRLDISVYNEMVDEDKALYMRGSGAGDYVVLCISDSGSGISKDVQQRMFDPFYSTKEKGKGTGLGLSLVHGFVRRSHGYVDVVSEPGAGAAFYIYLPRSVKDKLKGLDSGVKDELPTGTETILVVDDEPQLVEVATIYLGDLGYRVLQATDTKQAMAFLQDSEKIDLLFSDIIMPGSMDGFDLSDAAVRLRPEIKVLLVSGYTPEDSGISKEAKKLSDQRLAKPYSKTELARRIRLVLDGEQKND